MANVKLKTNMIIEGAFYKFGTLIDEQKVPTRYRKKKFILREGEVDYREKEMQAQISRAEQELKQLNESNEIEGLEETQSRRNSRR